MSDDRQPPKYSVRAVSAAVGVAAGFALARTLRNAGRRSRPPAGRRSRYAVTIARPRAQVYERWMQWSTAEWGRGYRALGHDPDRSSRFRAGLLPIGSRIITVEFRDAPGKRGTEAAFELVHRSGVGASRAKLIRLAGKGPKARLEADARRFKATLEADYPATGARR
ncbi:MAG: hypothetical protein M3T49_01185 [Candidatus Eremiobacteraeota bacterium]|nr:hypothetical protein [Candidatus Eremiobacteraeota bacterium]